MSLNPNHDDDRLDLLNQIVLQCQVDHLERCWILGSDAADAEQPHSGSDRSYNDQTLDRFDELLLESFVLLDDGASPLSFEEGKEWLEDLLVRFLIDSF